MRLIYMGTPDFAVPPLEMLAQAKLDAVINRIPDEEIRRSLQEG